MGRQAAPPEDVFEPEADPIPRQGERREHCRQTTVDLEVDAAVGAKRLPENTHRRADQPEHSAVVDDAVFVEHTHELAQRLERPAW